MNTAIHTGWWQHEMLKCFNSWVISSDVLVRYLELLLGLSTVSWNCRVPFPNLVSVVSMFCQRLLHIWPQTQSQLLIILVLRCGSLSLYYSHFFFLPPIPPKMMVLLAFLCNVTEYGQSPIKEYNRARSSINNCSAKLLLKLMGTPCAPKCKNSPPILTSYFSLFILSN